MIDTFNRRQILRALVAILLSLLATGVTIAFFSASIGMVLERFDLEHLARWIPYAVGLVMVVIFYSGWDLWRRGFGHESFVDSDFAEGFDRSTGSGTMANMETAEGRLWAYLISQIALAAPLQLLKAYDRIRSRIPDRHGLEGSLRELLGTIRAKNRWHSITEYRGRETEVMYLVRMGHLDFSPRRGSLRPKT